MDNNTQTKVFSSCNDYSYSLRNKNIIITILLTIIFLMLLGINILNIFGSVLNDFFQIFSPVVKQILALFGYTAGTVINSSADVASDVAKAGIDIAEGTIQDVGNLLKNASDNDMNPDSKAALHRLINDSNTHNLNEPKEDSASNIIQQPIPVRKNKWCLIEDEKMGRKCSLVSNKNTCSSGQIFPNESLCLNPTISV
jgi:hypothetical protein